MPVNTDMGMILNRGKKEKEIWLLSKTYVPPFMLKLKPVFVTIYTSIYVNA